MNQSNLIAVIGGTGSAGRYVVSCALQQGYRVRMLVRNARPMQLPPDMAGRLSVVQGDVMRFDSLRELLTGCAAVINTFGRPPQEEPVYSVVTRRILEEMERAGIRRYIGVTGTSLTLQGDRKSVGARLVSRMLRSLHPQFVEDRLRELHVLQSSAADWTLVRLPMVKEGQGGCAVKADIARMTGNRVYNGDVARFLVGQLQDPEYIRRCPFIGS
ncbi:NAD(P)H-binding protein [Saccharibacillus sp. CPCC 101409]|uniref:NAD(P)-dependent oxidoreductase n=1 Tax=Saccharibacillus sp. CPCC 101409 TaxID=3058041 RepID=UPI002673DCE9|nr:NAD(P)H-binding protein [Saccharibacillus sp. CPCC 101409]MDO3408349.1 NAD(P)H-binding protein [Saccharibacillus sp. CPCC 101409]